jgi:aspartate 1-decarboxylase
MTTRKMMRAKIHRATVTQADVDYEGSITIDQRLLDATDLLPNEAVCVWNVTVIDAACHYFALAIARHRSNLNLEGNCAAAQDDATQELE